MSVIVFSFFQRHVLRDEFLAIFAVVISPALNRRDVALPVTVSGFNGRRPFQRVRTPGVFGRQFATAEDGIEEVDDEQHLQEEHHNRRYGDEFVQVDEVFERIEVFDAIITARHAGHTGVVHGPEHCISADKGAPKVNFTQCFVHVATEHFREPVIYATKHPEERRNPHYNVEVRYYEIRVVHLDVDGRVAEEDTCQTTRDKHRHEADSEKARRIEAEVGAVNG